MRAYNWTAVFDGVVAAYQAFCAGAILSLWWSTKVVGLMVLIGAAVQTGLMAYRASVNRGMAANSAPGGQSPNRP